MTEHAHTKFNQKQGSASEISALFYSSVSLQYHAGSIVIDLEYVLLMVDSVFSYYTFLKCLFFSNLRIQNCHRALLPRSVLSNNKFGDTFIKNLLLRMSANLPGG